MNNHLLDNLQALNLLYQSRMNFPHLSQLNPTASMLTGLQNPLTSHSPSQPLPFNNATSPLLLKKPFTTGPQTDPNMLLFNMYYKNVQAELLKSQMASMKQQFEVGSNPFCGNPVAKEIVNDVKIMANEPLRVLPRPSYDSEITLEFHIKHIVNFLIMNFGRINQRDLEAERQKYEFDQSLTQVFDALVSKYSATTKTKEEMIKYVLRKALKHIKDKAREGTRRSEKEASRSFCQKYFSTTKEEIQKLGVDIEDEEELLKLLLPFKKTSKNKTMNANFLAKLFASEEFCGDYCSYLNAFEKDADIDNNSKVKKFVTFILSCVKSKKINSIMNYKRVPWLKIWLINTKNVGLQLMKEKNGGKTVQKKKVKCEYEGLSDHETTGSECKVEVSSSHECS